ncbi:hypothetical protein AC1031_011625 [Aphanomyces cochlioides]|nr:hypothetical protein AC1031_011625 [Aphanomyces cochlioides]
MASEGELEWWKLDVSEAKPTRNSPAASASPPFRSPSRSRPSSSDGPPSLRRFQLQENEDKARTVHQQNLYAKQLDEQVREKELRKAKEAEEQRRRDEEAAQQEIQQQKMLHIQAQRRLGHVASTQMKRPPSTKYASSGGTTTFPSLKIDTTTLPPPVPVRVPSASSPRQLSGGLLSYTQPQDHLNEMYNFFDDMRMEFAIERRRREENDAKFQEALYMLSKLQVDLQNQQDQFREFMMSERASFKDYMQRERSQLQRDRDAFEREKRSLSRHSARDTMSPYKDSRTAYQAAYQNSFHDDSPVERSMIFSTSEFVPVEPAPLQSVDENNHNRRVIQASGKYDWDREDAVAPVTPSRPRTSEKSNKLFQVKELVN